MPPKTAKARHLAKAYDRVQFFAPKGAKEQLVALAQQSGAASLTAFIAGILERETGVKCTLDGVFGPRKPGPGKEETEEKFSGDA